MPTIGEKLEKALADVMTGHCNSFHTYARCMRTLSTVDVRASPLTALSAWTPRQRRPSPAGRLGDEQDLPFDPSDHVWDPFTAFEIGANERAIIAHFLGITPHYREIGPNGGGEVESY